MPVEVKVHTMSHFKAPINSKVDLRGPECDGMYFYIGLQLGQDGPFTTLIASCPVLFVSLSNVLLRSAIGHVTTSI